MTDWPFVPLVLIACTLVIMYTLPVSTLDKDLHYQSSMLLSFVLYVSHFCQRWKLFYNMGGVPPRGGNIFQHFIT